jgi:hypothetical protein
VPANDVARWNGTAWSPLGSGIGFQEVRALHVFDDGSGPALFAAGWFGAAGGVTAYSVAKWNGSNWSALSTPFGTVVDIHALTVFDGGTGPALMMAGGLASVTRYACGGSISLSVNQVGPAGSPVSIVHANLIPGLRYYTAFSRAPCPSGIGNGPYLGLCLPSRRDAAFVVELLTAPLDATPFRFVAAGDSMIWGPYPIAAGVYDGVCFEYSSSGFGATSAVMRMVVQ